MKPTVVANNNIKFLRFKANLSQTKLANLAGCSREAIQKIENNNMIPSVELAHNIAISLGVTDKEIFVFKPTLEATK